MRGVQMLKKIILLMMGYLVSTGAFALEGDNFQCEDNRFVIKGQISSEKMTLKISDVLEYVTLDKNIEENFEFTPTSLYTREFGPNGKTFEAATADYMLALHFPKKAFSKEVK